MKTVILAGGFGTRLRSLNIDYPKILLQLGNKRILDYLFVQLMWFGYSDFVITTHHMRKDIIDYVGEHWPSLHVEFPEEPQPLGTAGSVKNAHINERMLIVQGDALIDLDLLAMVEFHDTHPGGATIGLKRVEDASQFGAVDCDELSRVVCFQEKPKGTSFHIVNTGIYLLEPWVFDYVPEDQPFDFARDLFPMLMEQEELYAYEFKDGFWVDVGTPEGYRVALEHVTRWY